MSAKIRWGILGPGNIARQFAKGVTQSNTGTLVAVASRSKQKADEFAGLFQIPNSYDNYEALLADKNVDAVYIATPHPFHPEWAIKAARAGKHVLVEKPIGLNHSHAMAVAEACEVAGVKLMEAYMYRCHPQTAKLIELIKSKTIGDVRMIQATFAFRAGFNENSRLFSNALGGGGILDVGGYPVSLARLVAGAAVGKPFADPYHVSGAAHLGTTGIDEWASAVMKFESAEPGKSPGIVAQIATGVSLALHNGVIVHGSDGRIEVPDPWVPAREGGTVKIIVHRNREQPQTIDVTSEMHLYGHEADAFPELVRTGVAPYPAMSVADTLANMSTLDRWRDACGFQYDQENPPGFPTVTVAGVPLKAPESTTMLYGTLPGVDKKISRLVMGCDNQMRFSHCAVMFDDFFERGGNCFDTAHGYGGGLIEKLLGQWIDHRGVRDQVTVIVKGVHSPYCFPDIIRVQLEESLHRQRSDCADIYIMHRDNPDVPVGEFVDALNDLKREGRIKCFGGSNWSLERVAAANEYARKNGKEGFSLVNNNFSLAEMIDPIWRGCVHSSDRQSRQWLREHNMPVVSWSSQARGFFVPGLAAPDKRDNAELVRCWYREDNFKRLERAKEIAAKYNVSTINIALAYVLNQPFLTFALIGPRTLAETRTSWPGLSVKLTPAEVEYLALDRDTPE